MKYLSVFCNCCQHGSGTEIVSGYNMIRCHVIVRVFNYYFARIVWGDRPSRYKRMTDSEWLEKISSRPFLVLHKFYFQFCGTNRGLFFVIYWESTCLWSALQKLSKNLNFENSWKFLTKFFLSYFDILGWNTENQWVHPSW